MGEAQNGLVELTGESFTYTPNADFSGSDTFTYTVQSEADATASSTVNVTVTPVNDPPTISQIGTQTLMAGDTADVPFTIEDLDNESSQLTVSAEVSNSAPPNLIANENITLGGSEEQRTLQIVTNPERNGTAIITVNVTDGQEPSSQPFLLTVTPLAGDTPLYRYWNPGIDHFYTIENRGESIGNWRRERGTLGGGIECYVFNTRRPGTVPLYRYWNRVFHDHFYTIQDRGTRIPGTNYIRERGSIGNGIECYVFNTRRPGTVPLYRYWNRVFHDHFYTIQDRGTRIPGTNYVRERGSLGNGIECWVNREPPN